MRSTSPPLVSFAANMPVSTSPLVRPAAPQDRDGLLALLQLRHSEFGLGVFDPARAAQTLQHAIDGTATIIAGVIAGDGGPEATIGLALAQWWDAADSHLEALWDYVHPDHRKTEHSRRLERFAELAADRLGVRLIMGGPIRAGHEGKVRAYCKHLRPIGAFFLYDGPDMARDTKRQREAAAAALIQAFTEAAK